MCCLTSSWVHKIVSLWPSEFHRLPNFRIKPTTKSVRERERERERETETETETETERVHDLLILMDSSIITNIYSRCNQPPLFLIMANVVYLISETSAITLRNLLKQDLTHLINPIFADFCCHEGISCLDSDSGDLSVFLSLVICNRFHNILRLFDILPNFLFTTSGTMRAYYLQQGRLKLRG